MEPWDYTTDLLAVGSGGGGMTAALIASDLGNETLIIEKSGYYGGSTAMSGGAIWVPDNPAMKREGLEDSLDDAFRYLKILTKGRVGEDRLSAFLQSAPEMVKYLEEKSHVKFKVIPEYSDYYAKVEGAKPEGGRTLEPERFNIRNLPRAHRGTLRSLVAQAIFFGRIMIDATEGRRLAGTTLGARLGVARMLGSFFLNPGRSLAGVDSRLTLGNALVARMRLSLLDREVPLWLETSVKRLVVEGERVVGVEAEKEGKGIRIRARKGVILAAGGFEKNQGMREQYQKPPFSSEWSVGNPENTGDAIRIGLEIGAAVDFMGEAWWMPVTMIPGDTMPWYTRGSWWNKIAEQPGSELPWFNIVDRCMPRSMIVNARGRRFTNEAEPYMDFINNLRTCHWEQAEAVPSWMIVDHKYYRTYPLGPIMPGFPIKKYIEKGVIKRGATLEELAAACGIDPGGLVEEVNRYNQAIVCGKDPDFQKGDTLLDRYYADPGVKPNPCLGPIEKPPFYAMRILPGDIGTKGGLRTDAHACVLREDGSPIEGLYATGNCAASVMGDTYPGAGATIAPAMVFGWRAARHAGSR